MPRPLRSKNYVRRPRISYSRALVGAYNVGRQAFRAYQSYSRVTGGRRSSSGNGVTAQHDIRMVYRKRRMPRRRRRRWVRQIKTSRAITLKNYGSRTRLFNFSETILGQSNTAQAFTALALYGQNGLDTTSNPAAHNYGMAHLGQIFADEGEQGSKLMFASGVMDCTFVNTGTSGIELDIYDIVWRGRNCGLNVNNDLSVGSTNTVIIPTKGPVDLSTRGATPFDLTEFLAQGYKILTKKKHLLPAGNTATYQMRDPRNRLIDSGDIYRNNAWARRGITRFILCLIKAIPGSVSVPAMTYGVTHKYLYKILEKNEDAIGV